MRIVAGVLLVALLAAAALAAAYHAAAPRGGGGGLFIVVTFPGLLGDVKALTCRGDRVVSLVPPGVDPHDYYLTPRGVALLRSADVIVSLGHTPLENAVHRLYMEGVLHGVLVEVPAIPGIRLVRNPVTGQLDLHMPVYDPRNYAVFVEYLAKVLAGLRPECRGVYLVKASRLVEAAEAVYRSAPRLLVRAVADSPATIYAVEWLGVRVVSLINPGYGLPATPRTILGAVSGVESGSVGLVVVTWPAESLVDRWLLELAAGRGLPVLYVYSPAAPGTVLSKIMMVAGEASRLNRG
ncbi:MAG: zinc ABC transporter solute-binding protein [Crenarchaeota archaeon]|nr:zinc ABC transporter solute-binding protein [Thermoproteota archaeon]